MTKLFFQKEIIMKSLLVLSVLISTSVMAKPAIMMKFKATYPASASKTNCLTCHANNSTMERNAYGQDLEHNGNDFKAIEGFDSDADGATNIAEITAGTLPGDKDSHPAL
jgi:hypothetical protein